MLTSNAGNVLSNMVRTQTSFMHSDALCEILKHQMHKVSHLFVNFRIAYEKQAVACTVSVFHKNDYNEAPQAVS